MIIKNVKIYMPDKRFVSGTIVTKEDKIWKVLPEGTDESYDAEEILDGKGSYCLPGMIDLHFHGCMGEDVCDGNGSAGLL